MKPLNIEDPRVMGPFELLARIGKGGMGVVFLARWIPLDSVWDELAAAYNVIEPEGAGVEEPRLVAVKMIAPDLLDGEGTVRQRFGQEIDAVRSVVSNRVPAMVAFEADPAAARPWFAMDYVAGPSLDTMVKKSGTFAVGPYAALGLHLVEALRAIHGAGLLHRDLKPQNVVLGPDGPVVLDFGLAVLAERASSQALTKTGHGVGTARYMPWEQVKDAKHVGEPADVYALGATLFFALTGRSPYPYGPMPVEPDWEGVAPVFLPLLAKTLVAAPGQRPDLDAVELSLCDLLAGADLTPELAAEQLRALVDSAGLAPKLPAEALTGQVDPAVRELALKMIDANLADVDPGFFGIVDTEDAEWAAQTGAGPAAQDPAHADEPPAAAPQPEPVPLTSYRIPPPRPAAGPAEHPEGTPTLPASVPPQVPPRAAQQVATDLREKYAHRRDL
ncbi:serine/threonine-protein kinase [Streptomyces sp. NPDC020983]|uniref:serine/threonine-protein kinase n=1 Tax=Streptomyces sp. NPDC020983 TaxID=3365106 RepID=UPI0037A28376